MLLQSKIDAFTPSSHHIAHPLKINLRHIILMLAWCLTVAIASGQNALTQITGLVRDSISHEGVPYATVTLVGTDQGTMATAQGGFTVNSTARFNSLRVSAVGYHSKVVPIQYGQGSVVIVDLVPTGVELGEVVVRRGKEKYSKDNPAVALVKKLRAHRDDNDPLRRHDYYSHCAYEKVMYGFADLDAAQMGIDSSQWVNEYADTSRVTGKRILPVSVREQVANTYCRRDPYSVKRRIIGTWNAGIDEQLDQASVQRLLEDMIGEINIFDNDVTLLTNRFVSPLSRLAVDFYKFYLNDTVMVDNERCAVLSFVPFTPQTFGFVGRLYVSLEDSTLFIKRVALNVPHDINLNYVSHLYVEQDFVRDGDGCRLKVRDDIEVTFSIMSMPQVFTRRATVYRDHSTDKPDTQIFEIKGNEQTDRNAAFMPDEFWSAYRPVGMKTNAGTMQRMMKRLRKSRLFYWGEQVLMAMINGYVPTGKPSKVDLGPLNTLVSGNSLEGVRLRVGGMTTVALSPHWFVRGYLAYGTRDRRFKHQASLEYSFSQREHLDQEFPIHSVRLSHTSDVDKLGQHYMYTNADNMFLVLKRHKDNKMQYLHTTRLEYRREWHNHLSLSLQWMHQVHEATDQLPMVYADGTARKRYTQAGFKATVRYAPGETFYQTRSYRIPINMDAPIMTLSHTWLPRGFMGSLHTVSMTEAGVQRRFWFSAFGYADVIVKAAKVWSRVAYPNLLIPNANLSYTIQPESYSLMKPMEFINDEYLSWDLTYWGNGVLMNRLPLIKRLRLREVVTMRGLWGKLSDKNNPAMNDDLFVFPADVLCQPMGNTPYMEAGVGLDNILTVLRVDYVWRLSYRNTSGTDRHGIRLQLHFNF